MSTAQAVETQSLDDILPAEEVHARHPHIPVSTLRWQGHQRKLNGAEDAGAFLMVGKKLMVNMPKYMSWLLKQG